MNPHTAHIGMEERVRRVFDQQPFMRLLGARLAGISSGRAELELPSRPELTQQAGYIHGGAVASLADVASGFAALTLFAPESEILTVEFKINLLAPARGERITAVGEVLRAGRTLTVCQASVFAWAGKEATLCAAAQQTLIQLRPPGEGQ